MSDQIDIRGIAIPTVSIISEMPEVEFADYQTYYKTPFGGVPLDLLSNPIARESFAQMYQPEYEGDDGESLALYEMFIRTPPQALEYRVQRDREPIDLVARIVVNYPLNDTFACDFKFKSNRLGEIFSCLHDMYETIYAIDDARWKESGSNVPPRATPSLLNRAESYLIWGHDMGDLIISGFRFSPVLDYPKIVHEDRVGKRVPRGSDSSKIEVFNIPGYTEYESLDKVDFSKLKNGRMIGRFEFILSS